MPYVNNKDADQPVHACTLISTFVVHCLDSIIPIFATLTGWFESYLVENPEDRFSRDMAQMDSPNLQG